VQSALELGSKMNLAQLNADLIIVGATVPK